MYENSELLFQAIIFANPNCSLSKMERHKSNPQRKKLIKQDSLPSSPCLRRMSVLEELPSNGKKRGSKRKPQRSQSLAQNFTEKWCQTILFSRHIYDWITH